MARPLLLLMCALFAVGVVVAVEEILPNTFETLFKGEDGVSHCNQDELQLSVQSLWYTDLGVSLLARYNEFRTYATNSKQDVVQSQEYFNFSPNPPNFGDFNACQKNNPNDPPDRPGHYRALYYGEIATGFQFDRLASLQCGAAARNSAPFMPIRIDNADQDYDDWDAHPVWIYFEVDGVLLFRVCSTAEGSYNYIYMYGTSEGQITCPAKEYPSMFQQADTYGEVTPLELRKAFKIPGDYHGALTTNNPYLATIASAISVGEVARDFIVSPLNGVLLDLAEAGEISPRQVIGGLCPNSACNCLFPTNHGEGWHMLAFGAASNSYYNGAKFSKGMEFVPTPLPPLGKPAKKIDLWFANNKKQLAAQYSYGYILRAHERLQEPPPNGCQFA